MEDKRKDRIAVTVYKSWDWAYKKESEVIHEGFLFNWGKDVDNYINIMADKGELVSAFQGNVQFHVDTVFKPAIKDSLDFRGFSVICEHSSGRFTGKFVKFYGIKAFILKDDGKMCVVPVEQL